MPGQTRYQKKAKEKCRVCGVAFKKEPLRRSHFIDSGGSCAFKCSDCGSKSRTSQLFMMHLKACSKEKKTCKICNITFKSLTTKVFHDKQEHLSTKRVYECYFCRRMFYHQTSYNNHMNLHTREGGEKCKKCHKTFLSKTSFRRHVILVCGTNLEEQERLRHELSKYKRDYSQNCYFCGKKFTSVNYYFCHLRKHIKEPEEFPCSECGKILNSAKSRKNHFNRFHKF